MNKNLFHYLWIFLSVYSSLLFHFLKQTLQSLCLDHEVTLQVQLDPHLIEKIIILFHQNFKQLLPFVTMDSDVKLLIILVKVMILLPSTLGAFYIVNLAPLLNAYMPSYVFWLPIHLTTFYT